MKNKRYTALFISLLIMIFAVLPAFAADESEKRIIRVACYNSKAMWTLDANGERSGFCADYLYKLTDYADWEIEYVDCTSIDDALTKLYYHQVDLVMPVSENSLLREYAIYSDRPIMETYDALLTKNDRQDFLYLDYDMISKSTIGAINGYSRMADFEKWSMTNQVSPKIKYYPTVTALTTALNNGEIDLIMTDIFSCGDDYKLIAKSSSVNSYALFTDKTIKAEFDVAASRMSADSMLYTQQLYNEYCTSYLTTPFTKAELEYTAAAPAINVGLVTNRFPIAYINSQTGDFDGISIAILDRISQLSGIKFNYIDLGSGSKDYNYLRDNNIEIVAGVEYSGYVKAAYGMSTCEPYLYSNKVVVARSDYDAAANTPVVATSWTSKSEIHRLQLLYPDSEIVTYDNCEECLNAIAKGKADVTVDNEYIVSAYLRGPRYSNLSIVAGSASNYGESLSVIIFQDGVGVTNPMLADGRLVSIINKATKLITDEEINNYIVENSFAQAYNYTIIDLIYKNPIAAVGGVSALVAFVALLVFLAYNNRRTGKEKALITQKNQQLEEAIIRADHANMAKSQFLARMSHEIRTPMNAVVGVTEIAKKHIGDEEKMSEYLNKITASSKLLINLINDVLDMSAIEIDKMKIASNPFDFKELITSLASIYYSQCKNKNIDFQVNLSNLKYEILIGDQLRVNQILLNLLSNAVKFTQSSGKISLDITQTSIRDGKVYIKFEVSDNGEGMSEELMQRLFKPFEQESTQTAQSHGGSGLGLSITKSLIELMHGNISVQSAKGQGTNFTVTLPFGYSEAESENSLDKFKNIRAMVIDDDRLTLDYTAQVLERIGVEHTVTHSPYQAIQLLEQAAQNGNGYDICFIDWKMPETDGIETTKLIREKFDSDTIIVIMSAYDLSEIESKAIAAGANMTVSKPMFQSTVFNVLMSLTGGKYKTVSDDAVNYDFKGRRVLLTEDNALNMEIATELLGMTGIAVEQAENGKAALEMFLQAPKGHYDIILMDIQMPVMDGYEAAKAIRNSLHADAKTVPIYAMTANAFTEDITAAISSGMNGHIAKPIDTKVLFSTIQRAFESK